MSNTQYDFVAVLMNSTKEARDARNVLQKLAENKLLKLEDAVIAHKHYSEVQLDKMVDWEIPGAIGGAWLGILVSAIISLATGGAGTGIVIAGAAGGFGTGLAAGLLADVGIPDAKMKSIVNAVKGDGAVLFVLAKTENIGEVLDHMAGFSGEVISSTLSADTELQINNALNSSG
ncbi:DUF1269 domain-containing protein [Parasedimentitalea psychrophila]|uniref:DUF1269 domain-containing protein n=1 Tax=Parasedimentitalea psychrophila TaxID=2997337 RepID=A0A9Y2L070_9RHOB|nr:DUF1269 domain-containing protein [Parasedimentitalea psychrophila]WIY24424.1 DUF1269 domain-containing protein [Parasedimentitalea psychrophila]